MKVRIGFALGGGQRTDDLVALGDVVDALDDTGFDSLWLPETFLGGTVDPIVGLSFAAARRRRLKLGTHLVGPGRNPLSLAKSLAQLDCLAEGRLLLVLVAGINDARERAAQGMATGDRTVWIDEHLSRMRAWWRGDVVDGLTLDSAPRQQPLEVWLGGQSSSALERAGRLGDGWIPGRIRLDDAVRARAVVEAAARAAPRDISPEHFGINLAYSLDPHIAHDVGDDARDVVAFGADALRTMIGRWVDAGFTKIVVRPTATPRDRLADIRAAGEAVLDLQT